MSKRFWTLAIVVAGLGGALLMVLLGILRAWFCGPSTCGLGSWLYDYQTLVAGLIAIAAAVLAVGGAWWLDRIQTDRDRQRETSMHVSACAHAAVALLPYTLGIKEVTKIALREARAMENPIFAPLVAAIDLAEQRCNASRTWAVNAPFDLSNRLHQIFNEFDIVTFKARIAVSYGRSPGAQKQT
jgi:hypothetical protein